MISIRKYLEDAPLLARVAPFVIFVLITMLQGQFGDTSRYWFYLLKTLAGVGMVWAIYPAVREMRWAFSWEAVVVGVGVFAIWVGLDPFYLKLDELIQRHVCPLLERLGLETLCPKPAAEPPTAWNPFVAFAGNATLAWLFVMVRIAGSTLVVPPIEEVFYRSFVYRYIAEADFLKMPLNCFRWTPFLVTALVFGLAHHEWLAGILCAFAYQGLVLYKNRLGDAMTAHAITNFLLGIWVVATGAWQFW
jgi:uncharacterized protein